MSRVLKSVMENVSFSPQATDEDGDLYWKKLNIQASSVQDLLDKAKTMTRAGYPYIAVDENAMEVYLGSSIDSDAIEDPCASYTSTSTNISDDCYRQIWKQVGCTTAAPTGPSMKSKSMLELRDNIQTLFNKNDVNSVKQCFGDTAPPKRCQYSDWSWEPCDFKTLTTKGTRTVTQQNDTNTCVDTTTYKYCLDNWQMDDICSLVKPQLNSFMIVAPNNMCLGINKANVQGNEGLEYRSCDEDTNKQWVWKDGKLLNTFINNYGFTQALQKTKLDVDTNELRWATPMVWNEKTSKLHFFHGTSGSCIGPDVKNEQERWRNLPTYYDSNSPLCVAHKLLYNPRELSEINESMRCNTRPTNSQPNKPLACQNLLQYGFYDTADAVDCIDKKQLCSFTSKNFQNKFAANGGQVIYAEPTAVGIRNNGGWDNVDLNNSQARPIVSNGQWVAKGDLVATNMPENTRSEVWNRYDCNRNYDPNFTYTPYPYDQNRPLNDICSYFNNDPRFPNAYSDLGCPAWYNWQQSQYDNGDGGPVVLQQPGCGDASFDLGKYNVSQPQQIK